MNSRTCSSMSPIVAGDQPGCNSGTLELWSREDGKESRISESTFSGERSERGDFTEIYAHSFQGLDGLQFGVLTTH